MDASFCPSKICTISVGYLAPTPPFSLFLKHGTLFELVSPNFMVSSSYPDNLKFAMDLMSAEINAF